MFSEICSAALARAGRISAKDQLTINAYVRATLRECHMKAFFKGDSVEDQLTATQQNHIWTVPQEFRILATVRYNDDVYPKHLNPGKVQRDETSYYYRAGNYFVFNGTAVDDKINLFYYTRDRFFKFYDDTAGNERPARFDEEAQTWDYWNGAGYVSTLGSTTLDQAAQDLVTDWLMLNWRFVIEEGAVAKFFKNINDPRAPSSFALYKSFQQDLLNGEPYDSMEL